MYDILQVIIFAETLPRTVLELVSVDLASLILSTSSVSPPPFDLHRAKKLIGGLLPKPSELSRLGDPSTGEFDESSRMTISFVLRFPSTTGPWSEQLRVNLVKLCQAPLDNSGTDALRTRQALDHLLRQQPSEKVALQVLTHLLTLVPSLPIPQPRKLSPADEANYALYHKIERAGSTLFSETPLLYSLVNDIVPPFLSTPTFNSPAQTYIERTKVEMLSDVVGGAFILALNRKNEDIKTQLDRLAQNLKSPVERAKSELGGDNDNPTLLRVFVERLSSYQSLVDSSDHFSKLSLSLLS